MPTVAKKAAKPAAKKTAAKKVVTKEAAANGFVIEDDEPWPTLLDPPSMQDLAPDKVTFVMLENGCFEAYQCDRMIRWGEHPRMWALLEQITSDKADGKIEDVAGLLLFGHPGLGKTMSLDLLLSWSLKAHRTVP